MQVLGGKGKASVRINQNRASVLGACSMAKIRILEVLKDVSIYLVLSK